MTDRVSDEQLQVLIEYAAQDVAEAPGPVHHARFLALTELRERRETERKTKEEKLETYNEWWTKRFLSGWTKDEP